MPSKWFISSLISNIQHIFAGEGAAVIQMGFINAYIKRPRLGAGASGTKTNKQTTRQAYGLSGTPFSVFRCNASREINIVVMYQTTA